MAVDRRRTTARHRRIMVADIPLPLTMGVEDLRLRPITVVVAVHRTAEAVVLLTAVAAEAIPEDAGKRWEIRKRIRAARTRGPFLWQKSDHVRSPSGRRP